MRFHSVSFSVMEKCLRLYLVKMTVSCFHSVSFSVMEKQQEAESRYKAECFHSVSFSVMEKHATARKKPSSRVVSILLVFPLWKSRRS